VSVRAFDPADTEPIVALSLRAWAPVFESIRTTLGDELFSVMYPDWRADQSRAVAATCAADGAHLQVATLDGRVVGFVAVFSDADSRVGEIFMIAVDPAVQRRGVGRLLTEHAHGAMAAAGMAVARVETGGDPGHAPARRLYESTGHRLWPAAQYYKLLDAPTESPPGPAGS
jgi:ribosomal protein S18 acetylase RimI-like enzyme